MKERGGQWGGGVGRGGGEERGKGSTFHDRRLLTWFILVKVEG